MNDLCFISLPFQPIKKMKTPFFYSTAILGEFFSNLFNCNYYLGINSLHSFKSTYKSYSEDECLDFEKNFCFINNKTIYYDRDYILEFIEIVKKLYLSGDIQIKENEIGVCECGRAEISRSELNRIKVDKVKMQLINLQNDEVKCRFCKKELVFNFRVNLFLCFKEAELNKASKVYPTYLNSDFNHFRKTLMNCELQISKAHNTGVLISIDEQQFNLDIDFLWKTIPFFLNKQNVVVIASSKHLFSLFIINYLSQIINHTNVYFVGIPFIETSNIEENTLRFLKDENHYTALKLLVLLGISWNKKSVMLHESTCKYFISSSDKNIELYKYILKNRYNPTEWDDVCKKISFNTNLQNHIHRKERY